MDSELDSSELGTKDYWENSYTREIRNYKSHGDVGEIWFDEDSQVRIVDWLMKQAQVQKSARVLDLGCGNGMFLVALANEGYNHLTGIDYSPKAIELANSIAGNHKLDISYKVADLTRQLDLKQELGSYQVIHDKGTYDAISLCPDNPKEKRTQYIKTVENLLSDQDSLFIITSCNWTEEELIVNFSNKFVRYFTIPTPTFKFGGKTGSVVTSMVFKKKKQNCC